MGIDFEFTTSQTMAKKLEKLQDHKLREVVAGALLRTLEEAAEMVSADVPGKYPDLKSSIRVTNLPSAASLHGSIGTDHPKAHMLEYGTGIYDETPGATRQPIDIRPVNKKVLKFTAKDGTVVYTKHVHYEGHHALAMFRKNYGRIKHRLNRNVKAAVDAHLGGN